MKKPRIGFIGQGWIGKNYADDFERRGYSVIRYALEEPYRANRDHIRECDIVFVAVPTPTTPQGFDASAVGAVLPLVGKGKIAVIKSTLIVGTTRKCAVENPHCTVLHSPEFLSKNTAAYDAAHPERNIVGIVDEKDRAAASEVLATLPKAPFERICQAEEAELIKYAHNIHGYMQVIFSNILYDIARSGNMKWDVLMDAFKADKYMSPWYLNPIDKKGRGAGGECFIKDFEAFIGMVQHRFPDQNTLRVLESIRNKNLELLVGSGKDMDLVRQVYGEKIP